MRTSDRYYQLLTLKLRVNRELESAGHGRAPQQFGRKWRLLSLRQRLRAKLNQMMTHPILLR